MPETLRQPDATVLPCQVRVLVRDGAVCRADPLLARLSCTHGPVAHAVQGKIANLLAGTAWPQTVAYLLDAESGALLALVSVCLDGHPNRHTFATAHTRRIARHPHVNILARDDRYANHVLRDGRTRLGTAALRAALEIVLRERPGPQGELPLVWGFVDPDNRASLRAFAGAGFHPRKAKPVFHDAGDGRFVPVERDLVVVRSAGKPLPAAPPADAYRPLSPHRADWDMQASGEIRARRTLPAL